MVGEDRSFESNSSVLECLRIDSGQILTKPEHSDVLLTFPEGAPEIEGFSRLGYCNGFKGLWLLYLQSIGYQLPGRKSKLKFKVNFHAGSILLCVRYKM
ncbi:hypothetical protein TNIN_217401 [Trichonephila inaurata madagascariensis]|uniref:Uncharacterized protein n=1 Tax=Trichonephila inaurata madagascariensis TaxID=2747483 RepID=A0A8X6XYM4_9ARAC|nr:hypothetical protein TNIN_217401 [Trichonephila inaurata madagascariensis]